jgi:DDE superfamily endonuclease
MPEVNVEAMNEHLAEISRCVSVGAIALLVLDGAGWHRSPRLEIPENIVLLPLPPYAPELNPVENVWEFIRANYLSHRVFEDYQAILRACRDAWNALIQMPQTITSIGAREWAQPLSAHVNGHRSEFRRVGIRSAEMMILAVAALTACADARDVPPFTVTVNAPAKPVASCVYRAIETDGDQGLDYRLTSLDDIEAVELVADLKVCGMFGCTGSRRIYSIMFNQNNDNTTKLEIRDHPTISGGHSILAQIGRAGG